ncbi:hypothetical protein J2X68_000966 [Streptomyces sp. 3330]|uniref:hypothetical protein n=1 Tax=Streptomyces sp. 3330 TaxID=2817755 RepID=UPI00285766DA|nr:hypothetical protein [Streptomyces sp. 3330]MDR6974288.1 hypothetical protein [Streptomyces sp. 3330]
MGERLGGDGVPGRRRAHPRSVASDPWEERDAATLEEEWGGVLRDGRIDPEAEQRALTAFRAAHEEGAHRARTRRRDDWRSPAERRTRRPVKMTLGVVFASLALGGVAVAAIGSVGSSTDGNGAARGTARPSAAAPDEPAEEAPSASSGVPAPTDGPATAQDTEAHCRAYEQVKDRGKALGGTAWQQLVTAAGGTDKVAAYCSERSARATATPSRPTGYGQAGNAGDSGNGVGGAGNAARNGQAGIAPGSGKQK